VTAIDAEAPTTYPVISADSHITEPPGTYVDYIDPAWRDKAPKMVDGGKDVGDLFVIDGMKTPVPMGLVAAAGKPAEEIRVMGVKFEDLHRSGWDPQARLADQARDGVAAEVIYPTVGMQLCNHTDFDYKKACFDAYNRWMSEYCSAHPDRLLGAGQTAMRSPEEGIEDLQRIRDLGLRGVMMPGVPAVEDYDSPVYDDFWRAAIDLQLPLSFHILTTRATATRGNRLNGFLSVVRGCQDIMGMLVFGGVFERHPDLRIVCVEADAGWVPHFMYRMDHGYKRHRHWLAPGALTPAVGVLRRLHLRHVPGRLDSVRLRRPDELAPAHVGQRLPPQRLHVAVVAGHARRAHRPTPPRAARGDPVVERRRALRNRPRAHQQLTTFGP
jgi:uncharacterized protein